MVAYVTMVTYVGFMNDVHGYSRFTEALLTADAASLRAYFLAREGRAPDSQGTSAASLLREAYGNRRPRFLEDIESRLADGGPVTAEEWSLWRRIDQDMTLIEGALGARGVEPPMPLDTGLVLLALGRPDTPPHVVEMAQRHQDLLAPPTNIEARLERTQTQLDIDRARADATARNRDDAVKAARAEGLTIYRIAKVLNVSQNAVRRILGV